MKNIRLKSIISLLSLMLFFGFTSSVNAAGPVLDWAKGVGGTGADWVNNVAVDSSGNTYATGYFTGTVDFDPGAGTSNLTSVGGNDIFVLKLDSSGDFVWVKQFGGTLDGSPGDITLDSSGNIYITGGFKGTFDFDPGVGTSNQTSAGGKDIFITKLNSSGELTWVKILGGDTDYVAEGDFGENIFIDSSNNIYIIGSFVYTMDFDPGVGVEDITAVGKNDTFLLKLDSSGDFVFASNLGGVEWGDWPADLFVDSSGNIYMTGNFQSTADFDPGAGTYNLTSNGALDFYVRKLDSSGDFVWAKSVGSTGWDMSRGFGFDSNGNIYITGFFTNTADFDPGAGTYNLTSNGDSDIFVLKLDSSGDFVWVKQFGGTLDGDDAYALVLDSSDNLYISARFADTVDFDPGAGTTELTSNGNRDGIVLKLDSSGDLVWVKQFGGTGDDLVLDLVIDSSSNINMIGSFLNTVDFDPNIGTYNLTSNGVGDIFILKLSIDSTAPTFTLNTPTPTDSTSINITWSTNENSSSIVEYGTTTNYGSTTAETDTTTGTTTHNVTLSNLTACTTYYYRVKSNDLVSNLAVSSNNTFKTSGCINTSGTSFAGRLMNMLSINKAKEVKSTNDQIVVLGDGEKGKIFVSPLDNQTKSCPGFNQYFRYGSKNDEIKLWQSFLNKEVGTNLSIDGSFGPATKKAVINFQEKYKTEILTPWKLSKGTGYIYQATRFKANELLGCAKPSLTLDNGVTLKK